MDIFYKYYNSSRPPFEAENGRYGLGVYFYKDLNLINFEQDQDKDRIVKLRFNNLKTLDLLESNPALINQNFINLLQESISEKKASDINSFIVYLVSKGYNSISVNDAFGEYMIIINPTESIFDVVSDLNYNTYRTSKETFAVGGEISKLPFVSASVSASIKDVLAIRDFGDLTEMEASLLYSKWKNDIYANVYFSMDEDEFDTKFIESLEKKNYVEIDYDAPSYNYWSLSNEYNLTGIGKRFVSAIMARYLTRLGLKNGTDLFPDNANVSEIDNKLAAQKNIWDKIKNNLESKNKMQEGGLIDSSNYFNDTNANFTIIDVESPEIKLQKIMAGNQFNFISESGSKYYIQHGIVYRLSDHWGQLGKCVWNINLPDYNNKLLLASCPLINFKRND